ncbi:MAG: DNA primase [Acidobacteriota bacterium]|nr:DNA primase [Acidobacteriota bacterium]
MKDRDLVERVKDATDLVALVGQAVKLRKSGAAYSGLCPFHSERSPSFQVVPGKNFYHCFGCGKHGDAFTWLMEREGLNFPEALEQLANAAGIEVPKYKERPTAEVDHDARLRAVLDAAQAWYEEKLRGHGDAQAYLKKRGISEGFSKEAGFGVAPESWDGLITALKGHGFSVDLIEQAGLASRTERGSTVDFLRNRLIIPIHDARGRLVAFGGRAFGDDKPKYMNTRETPLFHKSETLFGMHRAKGVLRDGAVVVEGYFDVLQLHQQGIHQAVAPMGTALTEDHLRLLGRFTKRLVLCFDGDAAGRRAFEKSLKLALPLGFDVRLLELPEGEDPDTWCLRVGHEAFRELIRRAPDWTSFMLAQALKGKDLRRIADRMEAFKELQAYLPYLPNTPERRELFASLAHQLQLPLSEINRGTMKPAPSPVSQEPGQTTEPKVDELLRPFLHFSLQAETRQQVLQLPHAWWEGLEGAPVLQALLDAEGDEQALPDEILALIRRQEAQKALRNDSETAPERAFGRLEAAYVQRELGLLNQQLQDPATSTDPDLCRHLESRQASLLSRKSTLARQLRGGFPA